jgi:hypothetical protein
VGQGVLEAGVTNAAGGAHGLGLGDGLTAFGEEQVRVEAEAVAQVLPAEVDVELEFHPLSAYLPRRTPACRAVPVLVTVIMLGSFLWWYGGWVRVLVPAVGGTPPPGLLALLVGLTVGANPGVNGGHPVGWPRRMAGLSHRGEMAGYWLEGQAEPVQYVWPQPGHRPPVQAGRKPTVVAIVSNVGRRRSPIDTAGVVQLSRKMSVVPGTGMR